MPYQSGANSKVSNTADDRIRRFLDEILQDERLSENARSALQHLRSTKRQLAEIDMVALAELLLEGLK